MKDGQENLKSGGGDQIQVRAGTVGTHRRVSHPIPGVRKCFLEETKSTQNIKDELGKKNEE